MKKNDSILLISLILYVLLFYHQQAGINFLVFTSSIIALLIIKDRSVIYNKLWIGAAIGSLLSSIAVFLYGNTLSVVANLVSLIILAHYSFQGSASLLLAGIHSSYTFISAIPYVIIRISEDSQRRNTNNNLGIKMLMMAVPAIVTMVFLFLYRSANPVFKNFTDSLSIDFITWEMIRFTIGGWILLYAFFNQVHIPFLTKKDQEGSDSLSSETFDSSRLVPRLIIENKTGILLFILLNVLLLLMNCIDINTLWISPALPSGVTHSELVHQGIELLIVSILIAIAIILYIFRGDINFYKQNFTIRTLAYLWIIQNAFLVATTMFKNQLYIHTYSLTYKRIGVYVYLGLTLIGLITTFIKIYKVKSNWFLIRKNGWIFYIILIVSSFVNWDLLITRYNIHYSQNLDKFYLLELAPSSLPELASIERTYPTDNTFYNNLLTKKIEAFKAEQQQMSLPSFCIEDFRVNQELNSIMHSENLK